MNAAATTASDNLMFDQIGLPTHLLSLLREIGYEMPSPIQAKTIPLLLNGKDLVGQAQTGTGKTAAFALPALARLKEKGKSPQVLVLTPTRELSIQVAEAFQTYATNIKGFSVLPIYGGQDYRIQLNALKRGPQVIVSTPGRLMDHMRRGTISLSELNMLVLDEADEMLRMGFIDDVQWILDQTPKDRQIALFSATMPAPIKRIAKKHLNDPVTVVIESKGQVTPTIRQRYWPVQGVHKFDALTRIMEVEDVDGVIIFVRTKTASAELADKLSARGMRCSALNGEMPQKQREQTVDRLRKGRLDILVATDVAARGLDVERISHVFNYDIPSDTESYVHRIGRTGRAGRSGEAVMFVAPRERRMLGLIEKAIGSSIEKLKLPTDEDINEQRTQRLTKRISDTLAEVDLTVHKAVIEQYLGEHEVRGADVAAALAHLLQESKAKSSSSVLPAINERSISDRPVNDRNRNKRERKSDSARVDAARSASKRTSKPATISMPKLERDMERFRLDVGAEHGAVPGMIVGAVANEAGIDSQYIGRISIGEEFTLMDLPEGMPKEIFNDLKKTRVCGRPLRISRVDVIDQNEAGRSRRSNSDRTASGTNRGDDRKTANPAVRNRKKNKHDSKPADKASHKTRQQIGKNSSKKKTRKSSRKEPA